MAWYDRLPEPSPDPPELPEPPVPRCPVCGEETDTLYRDRSGDVAGCGECLRPVDAYRQAV